jgi:uncharacterized protein YndB with AHSA1/START domain
MPANKDLKRLVRARMKKTGEAYTTARSHILNKPSRKSLPDYAALAGMSDAVIKEKTGCTWERWVKALDHHGAANLSHGEVAALVKKTYKVGDWWSQTVTVGYERIKGLRAKGQRRDGTYEASKSRTFDVPVKTLYEAWADDRTRRGWLTGATVRVRTATSPKSIRLDWNESIVAVGFTPKSNGKSSVAVQHTKLPDRDTANKVKEYWTERLDALAAVLAERSE